MKQYIYYNILSDGLYLVTLSKSKVLLEYECIETCAACKYDHISAEDNLWAKRLLNSSYFIKVGSL